MRKSLSVCFAIVMFLSWAGIGFSQHAPKGKEPQNPKVHPGVWQKVQEKGFVGVIVRLDIPWQREGKLSKDRIPAQRKAIADAQKRLLAELAGTNHKLGSLAPMSPVISLEVDAHALKMLENSPLVLRVSENVALKRQLFRSVPFVGVGQGSTGAFDGTGFAIAILDDGVDKYHPFLQNKVIAEWCFSQRGSCPNGGQIESGDGAALPCTYSNKCTHGTHVAGIVAGVGPDFSGVAKGAKIIAVQIFSQLSSSECPPGEPVCDHVFTIDIFMGLDQIFTAKDQFAIAAVNLSLGGGNKFPDQKACDEFIPDIKAVIDDLRVAGIATVIASGNEGFTDGLAWPACISSAVSVGATAVP